MLKITKSKKQALSESAKNYLKNKRAKKVEESCGLKEDIDISRWDGKWDDGRYIIDRDKLVQALKYAAKDFIDNPKDGGCFTFPIDDRIGVVVGWESGYDAGDSDGFIADNGWHVVAGLKCYTSDDMRTDYEWINFPYFTDGEVIDYWEEELPANLDDGAYRSIADYLIKGYEDELSKYEYAKNGEIIDSEIDEDDVDDAFISDVELTSDDMNAGQWYESLKEVNPKDVEELNEDVRKEWKPDTSFKHIKKVLDDAIARGKYVNNEREEVLAAMDKADKGGYTPEQRKFIRDKHADMWRKNRNANECVKEGKGEGKDKFEGTPKEYVHADRDLFLKKLQQRGHRKPIVKSEEIPLTDVKESKGKGMIDVLGKIKAESCGKKKSRKKLKEALNFVKLNDEPIEIEYVEDEHDESRDFQPSFWWWNRRYYLDDFIRIHNNPWVSSVYDEYPEYIHAYESDNYHNPLYIEITDDGDYVNVYEEKESTNESCKGKCNEDAEIKRYSDVVPKEKRRYWYFTTHGVQPGSIPKGVNVLEIRDGVNDRGTKGTFVLLDAILNTSELKDYDMRELAPRAESCDLKERGLTRAEKHNRAMDRIFDTYRKQNDALAKFLLDNGYSEDKVDELRKADKLNAEVYDNFGGSDGVAKALAIKAESCGKKK